MSALTYSHVIKTIFKRMVLIVICLSFIPVLYAQLCIGIGSGYTSNHMSMNTGSQSYLKNENKSGYSIGMPVFYRIAGKFAINFNPNWMTKNYSLVRTGPYSGIYESFSNSYLQFPVLVSWRFDVEKIIVFVEFGGYVGYWTAGRVSGKTANVFNVTDSISTDGQVTESYGLTSYSQRYSFDVRRDNRVETGWTSGFSVQYCINEKYLCFLDGKYYQALTDQQKNYTIVHNPRYDQTISVSAGLLFRTHPKKQKNAPLL